MMERDAILALEGRELDAMVAEVVFGWKKERLPMSLSPNPLAVEWAWGTPSGGLLYQVELPAYSSTWEGMGLVVAELSKREMRVEVKGWNLRAEDFDEETLDGCPLDDVLSHAWQVSVDRFVNLKWKRCRSNAETAPLAVARAALLALSGEE